MLSVNQSIFSPLNWSSFDCSFDLISQSGGPTWDVPKGRKDGRTSEASETVQLPAPTFNISQLQQSFSQRGLSMEDLAALLGKHVPPSTVIDIANCIYVQKMAMFWLWLFCRRAYSRICSLFLLPKQNKHEQCRPHNKSFICRELEECLSDPQQGKDCWC